MGRQPYAYKNLVHESKRLDIITLQKSELFHQLAYVLPIQWTRRGKKTGSAAVIYQCQSETLTFFYSIVSQGSTLSIEVDIKVTTTPCYFGGKRSWFVCPQCNRRIKFLYFVKKYPTCRTCSDLVYESSRDAHKFDSLLKQQGVTNLKEGRKLINNFLSER